MSNWLRLALITMTVGGGFTGVALTLQALLSPQVAGPALVVMCIVFLLLHVFILISGLMFVMNAQRVMPLVVALALQLPYITSPIIAYHLGAGLHGGVGVGERGFFYWIRLGSDWQFNLLQPLPSGLGVNLVAVFFLAAVVHSMSRQGRRGMTAIAAAPIAGSGTVGVGSIGGAETSSWRS
jgi:hypothetical protein